MLSGGMTPYPEGILSRDISKDTLFAMRTGANTDIH